MLATLVLFKWTHFIILLATVFAKIFLAVFYHVKNKKIGSDILKCACFDSILDASITFMTVMGLLLTKYVQLRLDGFFGIAVSIVMIVGGVKIFVENLRKTIGTQPSKAVREDITRRLCGTGAIEKILSTEYHEYGPNEQKLFVNAVFTNDAPHDIIKNEISEIENIYGIKIIFTREV